MLTLEGKHVHLHCAFRRSLGVRCRASRSSLDHLQRCHQHPSQNVALTRREIALSGLWLSFGAGAAEALPLAPLGSVSHIGGDKRTGISLEQLKSVLEVDLRDREYFVTGNLTPEVFADDCRFVDPTNDVTGLSKYVKALQILFDPDYSRVELEGVRVTGPDTLEADWTMGGYLKFPWKPRITKFKGHTVYTVNKQGLIQKQEQQWSKPGTTALVESFTPTSGPTGEERVKRA